MTVHRKTKFFCLNQWHSASELIDLEGVPLWISDVQKVVRFCLYNEKHFAFSTSGSTGKSKVLEHSRSTLFASAQATIDYFDLKPGNTALLCLPAKFTGGAMMIIRACLGGIQLVLEEPNLAPSGLNHIDFLPLTPAQYITSIEKGTLEGFKGVVLLGGSPISAVYDVPTEQEVFIGYGMTETASHLAVRRLGDKVYESVGETSFRITDQGCLAISAPHLSITDLETNDIVQLMGPRSFQFIGRVDFVINSGGIKIHPEEWERILSEHGIEALISSNADPKFGEQTVLVLTSTDQVTPTQEALSFLPKIVRPKKAVILDNLPLNFAGKPDRIGIKEFILSHQDLLFQL